LRHCFDASFLLWIMSMGEMVSLSDCIASNFQSLRAIYLPCLARMSQLFLHQFLDQMPCLVSPVGMVGFRFTPLLRLLRSRALRWHGERMFMNKMICRLSQL
jgi:hypothetical protein